MRAEKGEEDRERLSWEQRERGRGKHIGVASSSFLCHSVCHLHQAADHHSSPWEESSRITCKLIPPSWSSGSRVLFDLAAFSAVTLLPISLGVRLSRGLSPPRASAIPWSYILLKAFFLLFLLRDRVSHGCLGSMPWTCDSPCLRRRSSRTTLFFEAE